MALTQAEKNFIDLMATNPEEAFKKIKDNKVTLDNFKSSFYKSSGIGLIHILVNGYNTNKEVYLPIIQYIMDNSNLCLTDKNKNSNLTGLEYFKTFYENHEFNNYPSDKSRQYVESFIELFDLTKKKDEGIGKHILNTLYTNNMIEEFTDFLNKHKNLLLSAYGYQDLIFQIIKKEDIKTLHFLFSNIPELKESVAKYHCPKDSYSIKDEDSNILNFCIHNNLNKSLDFLIDNSNSNINGKVNVYSGYYGSYKRTSVEKKYLHTLQKSLMRNNKEAFENIFNRISDSMSSKDFFLLLNDTINTDNKRTFFNMIINHSDKNYYNLIKSNILEAKFDEKDFYETMLTSNIFRDFLSAKDLNFINNEILDFSVLNKSITEHDSKISIGNFIDSIYKIEDKTEEDYNNIDSILYKYKDHIKSKGFIFTEPFFTDEKLFHILNKHYLLNEKEPQELLNVYIKYLVDKKSSSMAAIINNKNRSQYTYNPQDVLTPEEFSFKLSEENKIVSYLYKNTKVENLSNDIISNIIKSKNTILYPKLTNEDIKHLSKVDYIISSDIIPDANNDIYRYFVDKLIELKYDFNDSKIGKNSFHWLLSNNMPIEVIDNALKNTSSSIKKLSEKPFFHKSIQSKEVSNYMYENGADYSSVDNLFSLMGHRKELTYFLDNGGNVKYENEDGGNILHYLVQSKQYTEAKLIADRHPDLASDINNQNKFPISYMITEFSKECNLYNENKNNNRFNRFNFDAMASLINSFLDNGLDSTKKKPLAFLKEQIKKYDSITEYDETILNKLEYGRLKKIIPNNNIETKKNKL